MPFDRHAVLARWRALRPETVFSPPRVASITQFLTTVEPVKIGSAGLPVELAESDLNHDLAPRDEYFLNNETRYGSDSYTSGYRP